MNLDPNGFFEALRKAELTPVETDLVEALMISATWAKDHHGLHILVTQDASTAASYVSIARMLLAHEGLPTPDEAAKFCLTPEHFVRSRPLPAST